MTIAPLDLTLSEEAEAQVAPIAGGLTLALARAVPILDPNVRNPQTKQ